MNGEIVYRHPKGRFMVHRRTFPFGGSYCEAEMTPEQDRRGLCCETPGYTEAEVNQPRREDVKIRKMTEADEEKICELYRAGKKPKEISERTGFRTQRILKVLAEKGVRDRKNFTPYTDEEMRLVYALHAQGWTARQIGERIGRTRDSVQGAMDYRRKGK